LGRILSQDEYFGVESSQSRQVSNQPPKHVGRQKQKPLKHKGSGVSGGVGNHRLESSISSAPSVYSVFQRCSYYYQAASGLTADCCLLFCFGGVIPGPMSHLVGL